MVRREEQGMSGPRGIIGKERKCAFRILRTKIDRNLVGIDSDRIPSSDSRPRPAGERQ